MISRFWFVLPNFITQRGVHHILIVALHLFIHQSDLSRAWKWTKSGRKERERKWYWVLDVAESGEVKDNISLWVSELGTGDKYKEQGELMFFFLEK